MRKKNLIVADEMSEREVNIFVEKECDAENAITSDVFVVNQESLKDVKPENAEMKKSEEASAKEEQSDKVKEQKEEIPPFITYGGEVVIKEEDNIVYYKTRYRFLTAMFKLVGKFDSKGRYIINEDIKRELVKIVKEIEVADADGYKAKISVLGKELRFNIKIVQIEDNKARASLFLEEYVGKTLKDEFIVTKIADYVDKDNDDFRINVRRVFNLSDVALSINEFDLPKIAIAMQNAIDIDLVVGELFDVASQIYLVRILKLLEETDDGKKILLEYKALLDGKENEYKRKFTYLRMILERVIDDNGGFEVLGLKKEDKKKLIENLLLSIQNLKKKTKEQSSPVVEVKQNEEKKSQVKSSAKPSAKKSAKKSGGGKEKKKDKRTKKKAEKKKSSSPLVFYVEENPLSKTKKNETNASIQGQTKNKSKLNNERQGAGNSGFEVVIGLGQPKYIPVLKQNTILFAKANGIIEITSKIEMVVEDKQLVKEIEKQPEENKMRNFDFGIERE